MTHEDKLRLIQQVEACGLFQIRGTAYNSKEVLINGRSPQIPLRALVIKIWSFKNFRGYPLCFVGAIGQSPRHRVVFHGKS
jgi:hypothetical protein